LFSCFRWRCYWFFVWMFNLVMRVGCWSHILLVNQDLFVSLCSVMFVLWIWGHWHLVHTYLESLYLLDELFHLLICNDSLSLLTSFCLKSTLYSSYGLLSLSTWLTYLFLSFHFYSAFGVRCVYCIEQIVGHCFFNPIRRSVSFDWRVKPIYTQGYIKRYLPLAFYYYYFGLQVNSSILLSLLFILGVF
jgi:hypothetical protein